MKTDDERGMWPTPTRSGQVSTAFAQRLARYGASPRLLLQLREVTEDRIIATSDPARSHTAEVAPLPGDYPDDGVQISGTEQIRSRDLDFDTRVLQAVEHGNTEALQNMVRLQEDREDLDRAEAIARAVTSPNRRAAALIDLIRVMAESGHLDRVDRLASEATGAVLTRQRGEPTADNRSRSNWARHRGPFDELTPWQIGGSAADIIAIAGLFYTGNHDLAVAAILLTLGVAGAVWFHKNAQLKFSRKLTVIAIYMMAIALTLGGTLGYFWGPALVPAASRDVDLWGYCAALGVRGATVQDPRVPHSQEGQFRCTGSETPINIEAACRWKWGPQDKPPTLMNDNNAYTWRCHPRYR